MLRAEELMVGDYLTFRDALKDNNLKYIRKDALLEWLESKIYQWKSYYNKATTNTERAYCQKMIRMYLKRFIYYINK